MAKKENVEYLMNKLLSLPKFPTPVYDAMLTWVFGSEERSIAVCPYIAFTTIRTQLLAKTKMSGVDKRAYREEGAEVIAACIDELLKRELSGREAFDAWHKEACEKVFAVTERNSIPMLEEDGKIGFSYGYAQNWLNNTIENMLLMENWNEYFDTIREHLHVPVDSFIMEAASEDLEILMPRKSGGYGKYTNSGSETDSKPWRRWDYSEYIEFQQKLREKADCPIDWEFIAWKRTKT